MGAISAFPIMGPRPHLMMIINTGPAVHEEDPMGIDNVLVVGSGLMGSGIAQVCAQAGIRVVLNDVSEEALERALKNIAWSVGKFVEKGRLQEGRDAVMERITTTADLAAVDAVDLAIEAVFEKIEVKHEIFKRLDQILPPETLIASNTSAIPITELAAVTDRPAQVLGLHFFSPVPMMAAVEVIKGIATSDAAADAGRRFVLQIGKEPIMVNRDVAGFVINRINFPSTIEAMNLVEAGVATIEDIDKGLRLASGRKMGIFETGDMVGLDVTYGAMTAMYQETGDPRFYPPLLLRRKVKAGHLGRKTGRGWYRYDENGNRIKN
jgi:3-hydroxybutyryl-CoA dehydrogenase